MDRKLYSILGVSEKASPEDIKKAFRTLAIKHHPDKSSPEEKEENEKKFKEINEAYGVLSDPQKRKIYDETGMIDGQGGPGMGDINDIFQNMFGSGPGNGFSFVFGGGDPFAGMHGSSPFDDILGQMFSGGAGRRGGNTRNEIIDVKISLSDIYHGTNKKVEFEILDMCQKCEGSGAQDPSAIIKCMMCKGEGKIAQQVNPFMVSMSICSSCGGKGTTIKNNKFCTTCKGNKTQFSKRMFELAIPKGIPNQHIVKISGKGAWNEMTKQNGDILFRVIYDIKPPFSLETNNVIYLMDITIDELLCGFEKEVDMYGKPVKVFSIGYFNPTQPYCIPGKGIPGNRKYKDGDFYIKFNVIYETNNRLVKYADIFQKVMKRKAVEVLKEENSIVLQKE